MIVSRENTALKSTLEESEMEGDVSAASQEILSCCCSAEQVPAIEKNDKGLVEHTQVPSCPMNIACSDGVGMQ